MIVYAFSFPSITKYSVLFFSSFGCPYHVLYFSILIGEGDGSSSSSSSSSSCSSSSSSSSSSIIVSHVGENNKPDIKSVYVYMYIHMSVFHLKFEFDTCILNNYGDEVQCQISITQTISCFLAFWWVVSRVYLNFANYRYEDFNSINLKIVSFVHACDPL